jgi:S-adenosylmethionine hydrolase
MLNNLENKHNFFALLTDFGFDFAVASMKGLILKDFPEAKIIDIDHEVKTFSILSGAFVIDKVYKYFPKGTIFICVVDPGVGSKREPILLDIGDYKFIGPNNGLFHYLLKDADINIKSYVIKSDFRPDASNTFHGRDLFTPAAIEISKGNLEIFSPIDYKSLIRIPILESGSSIVAYIDRFGNIKTNILLDDNFKRSDFLMLSVNGVNHKLKISSTFSDVPTGELLCYLGSNKTLEIAANLADASRILGVQVGDRVSVQK